MTFSELKAELRPICWPDGEAENLLGIHDAFFTEALYDLTKMVPCYGFPHSDVFEHCASFFNCGMTVLPKPQGAITRLYTVDRLNPDTGMEDAAADEDHCAKVEYTQVSYEMLRRYAHICERCNATIPAADALLTSIFGIFRVKRRYPRPTDEGFENQPPLPPGFHYPQTSTDASGRSAGGVWAIQRGRIYVVPWIQSTESVVVEWVGLKTKWNDGDDVEDDIKFKQAVREHVLWQHESAFGEPARAQDLRDKFYGNQSLGIPGSLPTLIHECKEQSRTRSPFAESGSPSTGANAAVGIGNQVGLFFNDIAAQYTATCPPGKVGSVTSNIAVGAVASEISVADANAKAQAKAQSDAQAKLVCEDAEVIYYNEEQRATASCPGRNGANPPATGTPITKIVPAGGPGLPGYSSTFSQQAANDAAYNAALRLAQNELAGKCTFHNAAVTHTEHCPPGYSGSPSVVTIPEGSPTTPPNPYDSTLSQPDANEKAAKAAREQARAALVCSEIDDNRQFICVGPITAAFSALCGGSPGAGCPPRTQLTREGSASECGYCWTNILEGPGSCSVVRRELEQRARASAAAQARALWCRDCLLMHTACPVGIAGC